MVSVYEVKGSADRAPTTGRTLKLVVWTIAVQILLLHLPPNVHVVAEFALATLLALACLEERAEDSLRINTERDLLCLHRPRERGLLLREPLLLGLGLLAERLLLFLVECRARFTREVLLLLDHRDLLLHLRRLVFLESTSDQTRDNIALSTHILHPECLRPAAQSRESLEMHGPLTDLVVLHFGGATLLLLLLLLRRHDVFRVR
jgi:hypothetical protein